MSPENLYAGQEATGRTRHPEVKWALGSIIMNKACGGYAIPTKLFQILKDDAVKVLQPICLQICKIAVATGLEKFSFHFSTKEGQC